MSSPHSPRDQSHDDEITPIISNQRGSKGYQTGDLSPTSRSPGRTASNDSGRKKQGAPHQAAGASRPARAVQSREGLNSNAPEDDEGDDEEDEEKPGLFRRLVDKYGAVELDNKGSVARDHLALERTFLAWLRTSLSFASIGIAITQLFRLNSTIKSADGEQPVIGQDGAVHLRQLGKPLGATFLAISIVVLLIGWRRYFESQHWIIKGKFPASRGSIVLVTLIAAALIITSLVVVLTVGKTQFEKRGEL